MIRTLSPSPIGFNGITTSVGGMATAATGGLGGVAVVRSDDHHQAMTALVATSSATYQSAAGAVRRRVFDMRSGASSSAMDSVAAGRSKR